MNRRKFVSKSVKTGAVSCAAFCLCGVDKVFAKITDDSKETTCEKKVEFTQKWIKRFIDILDSELDEETRIRILESNGKSCYRAHLEEANKTPESIPQKTPEEMVQMWNKYSGGESEAAKLEGNEIYLKYIKTENGLLVKDGYCLCPHVENGPKGLSGSYCHCSAGFLKEMFNTWLKKPVEVELLESVKRGGNSCSFRIIL